MLVVSANSKILFAINHFTLSVIYHVHGMNYRVLSEPHVYISSHYRHVQGLHGADDIGTGAPDSCGALSRCRSGPAHTVIH